MSARIFKDPHLLRHQQYLHEHLGQLRQKGLAKAVPRIVIGMQVPCNETEGNTLIIGTAGTEFHSDWLLDPQYFTQAYSSSIELVEGRN